NLTRYSRGTAALALNLTCLPSISIVLVTAILFSSISCKRAGADPAQIPVSVNPAGFLPLPQCPVPPRSAGAHTPRHTRSYRLPRWYWRWSLPSHSRWQGLSPTRSAFPSVLPSHPLQSALPWPDG